MSHTGHEHISKGLARGLIPEAFVLPAKAGMAATPLATMTSGPCSGPSPQAGQLEASLPRSLCFPAQMPAKGGHGRSSLPPVPGAQVGPVWAVPSPLRSLACPCGSAHKQAQDLAWGWFRAVSARPRGGEHLPVARNYGSGVSGESRRLQPGKQPCLGLSIAPQCLWG